MKEVHKDIEVRKGGDVSVFQEVMMEDEVLVEEVEGDSVLRQFLLMLNFAMRLDKREQDYPFTVMANDGDARNITDDFYDATYIDASTSPIVLGFGGGFDPSNAGFFNNSNATGVLVGGVDGNDDLNGYLTNKATHIGGSSFEISVSTTGSEDISTARGTPIFDLHQASSQNQDYFSDPDILLGQSTLSNTTGQLGLNLPLVTGQATGQIDYGGKTINTPVIDLNQQISTITISRDVTNQTASNIPVEEVGLYTRAGITANDQWGQFFIGRDLLSTSVPASSTITFNYKFRTTCESSGGILVQFNELLYRQFAESSRTVQDIFNNNRNGFNDHKNYYASVGGGYGRPKGNQWALASAATTDIEEYIGIQVGQSTQVVDEADFGLKNRVGHGDNTGDLYYHGQSIGYVVEDTPNDRYYFDVVRFFENRSGGSLDIGEVGFNVSPAENDTHDYAVQIFRHQVDPTVTVATTELLKVTYRVSVKPKA